MLSGTMSAQIGGELQIVYEAGKGHLATVTAFAALAEMCATIRVESDNFSADQMVLGLTKKQQ